MKVLNWIEMEIMLWCARFRAQLYPLYSVESRSFSLVLYVLHSILPCSCPRSVLRLFQVFLEILRWNGSRSRLRHHNRRRDTNIKAFSSTPSNPREPCTVLKPSDTSRICFEEDLMPFHHPFSRTGAGSSEWAENIKGNSSKPTGNGEWCWIRSNAAEFGRMDYSFRRMASKLYQNVPGLAGNPEWSPIRSNGCPFGRMHLQFSRIKAPDCAISFLRKPNSEGF